MKGNAPGKGLSESIKSALPTRTLKVSHEVLAKSLVDAIEQWKLRNEDAAANATQLKTLVGIADRLEKALKTANGMLDKLGVDDIIERIRNSGKTNGFDFKPSDIAQMDPAVYLYSGVQQSLNRVRKWNRMARPGKGRPLSNSALLSHQLEYTCRKWADLTQNEFSDFLSQLSDHAELPDFVAAQAALKKRRERSNNRPKTK